MNLKRLLHQLIFSIILIGSISAQDPNFHIYLCFGQSNMEGQGAIGNEDKNGNERFQVFQSLDCNNLSRNKEMWYTAEAPSCQCYSGLSPANSFGKTMIDQLPDSISVGIINVAVGGCDIRLFDKDIYQDHDATYNQSWFLDKVAAYEGNPYQYLINLAKKAQNDGVIKGILLHQGETNTGQNAWTGYVDKIYTDMLTDLSLTANNVPILAGELLAASGNCCSSMNTIINKLPDVIPTAYVISSEDCDGVDNAHFDSDGYRLLGQRYAETMLNILEEQNMTSNVGNLELSTVNLEVFPNPLKDANVNVSFEVRNKTNVSLKLIDQQGRLVTTITDDNFPSGKHSFSYDSSKLSKGVYYFQLNLNGQITAKELIVLD